MANSTSSEPHPYEVVSWTSVRIPASSRIEDETTEDGKKWRSIVQPLTRDQQPGFMHAIWGRVIEDSEEVWLVTG